MRKEFFVLVFLVLLLGLTGCDAAEDLLDSPPATERPLMSFDFEDACRRGVVAGVSDYDTEAGGVHPIAVFRKYEPDTNSWSYMYPSELKFPIPWMVNIDDDDFTIVELVACADMLEVSFDKECTGYTDDESDDEFILRLYNVVYEVTVYTAATGEVLGTEVIESPYGDCPMFAMFSDPVEDRHASLPAVRLQTYLEQFVEP